MVLISDGSVDDLLEDLETQRKRRDISSRKIDIHQRGGHIIDHSRPQLHRTEILPLLHRLRFKCREHAQLTEPRIDGPRTYIVDTRKDSSRVIELQDNRLKAGIIISGNLIHKIAKFLILLCDEVLIPITRIIFIPIVLLISNHIVDITHRFYLLGVLLLYLPVDENDNRLFGVAHLVD